MNIRTSAIKSLIKPARQAAIIGLAVTLSLQSLLSGVLDFPTSTAAPNGDVIVRSSPSQGWNSGSSGGGATSFVADPTAPYGTGALEMTTNSGNPSRAQRTKSISPSINVADLATLSYATKYVSGPIHAAAALQITINGLTGASSFSSTTLVYEPYWNGTVNTAGDWQTWNTLDGGKFWSTTTVAGFTNGSGGAPFYTIDQVKSAHPNAKITSVKLNIGTYNPDWVVRADGLNFNGTVYDFEPAANPIVSGENFNTHNDADYKGINVGFNINNDFGTVSAIKVELFKNADLLVTNNHNSALLNLVNVSGERTLSTPFIITPGTYTETYWNLGSRAWAPTDKPTKAVVTVTGINGTRTTELSPLTEPNSWLFEGLFPPQAPINLSLKETVSGTAIINNGYTNKDQVTAAWQPAADETPDSYKYTYWNDVATSSYNSANPWIMPTGATSYAGTVNQGEGLHHFAVRAVKGSDESELSSTHSFTYDITKPQVELTTPSVNAVNPTTLSVQATDNFALKTVTANIYNATNTGSVIKSCSATATPAQTNNYTLNCPINGLAEGTYTIRFNARDMATNISTTKTSTFIIDNTAPVITVKNGVNYTPASIGNGTIFSLVNFKLYDSNKVWKTTLNGVEKTYAPNNWSDLNNVKPGQFGGVEGLNTLVLFDLGGNSTSYQFYLDTQAPIITTNVLAENYYSGDMTIDEYVDETNPKAYHFYLYNQDGSIAQIDGANTGAYAWMPASGDDLSKTIDTTKLADGRYYVLFSARDLGENTASLKVWFNIDNTAPAMPVHLSPADNSSININDFYFDWTSVSDAVAYEFQSSQNPTVDGNGVLVNGVWNNIAHGGPDRNNLTDSTIHSYGANGTWYWQVRAIDAAGHKSAWTNTWKLTIDMEAPAPLVEFTNPGISGSEHTVSGTITISGSVQSFRDSLEYSRFWIHKLGDHADNVTELHRVNGNHLTTSFDLDTTTLENGVYRIYFIAEDDTDEINRVSSPKFIDLTVNNNSEALQTNTGPTPTPTPGGSILGESVVAQATQSTPTPTPTPTPTAADTGNVLAATGSTSNLQWFGLATIALGILGAAAYYRRRHLNS